MSLRGKSATVGQHVITTELRPLSFLPQHILSTSSSSHTIAFYRFLILRKNILKCMHVLDYIQCSNTSSIFSAVKHADHVRRLPVSSCWSLSDSSASINTSRDQSASRSLRHSVSPKHRSAAARRYTPTFHYMFIRFCTNMWINIAYSSNCA